MIRLSSSCWLSVEDGMIWAFAGPVLCVLSVNFVLFVVSLYKTRRSLSWKKTVVSRSDPKLKQGNGMKEVMNSKWTQCVVLCSLMWVLYLLTTPVNFSVLWPYVHHWPDLGTWLHLRLWRLRTHGVRFCFLQLTSGLLHLPACHCVQQARKRGG